MRVAAKTYLVCDLGVQGLTISLRRLSFSERLARKILRQYPNTRPDFFISKIAQATPTIENCSTIFKELFQPETLQVRHFKAKYRTQLDRALNPHKHFLISKANEYANFYGEVNLQAYDFEGLYTFYTKLTLIRQIYARSNKERAPFDFYQKLSAKSLHQLRTQASCDEGASSSSARHHVRKRKAKLIEERPASMPACRRIDIRSAHQTFSEPDLPSIQKILNQKVETFSPEEMCAMGEQGEREKMINRFTLYGLGTEEAATRLTNLQLARRLRRHRSPLNPSEAIFQPPTKGDRLEYRIL